MSSQKEFIEILGLYWPCRPSVSLPKVYMYPKYYKCLRYDKSIHWIVWVLVCFDKKIHFVGFLFSCYIFYSADPIIHRNSNFVLVLPMKVWKKTNSNVGYCSIIAEIFSSFLTVQPAKRFIVLGIFNFAPTSCLLPPNVHIYLVMPAPSTYIVPAVVCLSTRTSLAK